MKETAYARFWMANGILFFVYKPIVFLDYAIARQIVNERLFYQQGTCCPVLCNLQGIQDSDKSARDYLANEGSSLVKAVAIIGVRATAKVLLHTYLRRSRPLVPTQMFDNQEEAIHYLKTFR